MMSFGGSRPWVVVNGRSSSSTDRFTPAKLPFSSNVGGQVNSRASLDVVQRRYFSVSIRK